MLIRRRQFLQSGSLATASLLLPGFLKALEKKQAVPAGNKVLVILQLNGGNDGLNTVIPVTNDIYFKSRPKLSIGKEDALRLSDDVALHPSLTTFKELYDDGSLAILNSVGYPNPDRSHFRSMDIWQSASDSKEYLHTGWIGRYLDAQCSGCDRPTQALEIDDVLSMALKGEHEKALAAKDLRRLYNTSSDPFLKALAAQHPIHNSEAPADYLYKTMANTVSNAEYIFRQSRLHSSAAIYPATELGKSFQTISSLILSDINTQVYYLSIGSFDTHTNQEGQQKRLFNDMNAAIGSFTKEMKENNRFNDVLLMTFSEFGRRVAQNASGGTDHGTANNMFFVGGGLRARGILNTMPDLGILEDGDLRYEVDFKNVYATILNKWLGADDELILRRKSHHLDFI